MAPSTFAPNPEHEDDDPCPIYVSDGTQITKDIVVTDCTFRNCKSTGALVFSGVNNAVVERCLFHNNGISAESGEALKISYGSRNIRVLHCIMRDNLRDGMDIFDAYEITVAHCLFEGNGVHGLEAKWNVEDYNQPSNFEICKIDVRNKIHAGNPAVFDVHGVNPDANPDGDPNPTDRNIIACNRAVGNGGDGLHVNVEHTLIMGNQCDGNTGNGIYINQGDNGYSVANKAPLPPRPTLQSVIADNICISNKEYGILLGGAQNMIVQANQCVGNTKYGIAFGATNSSDNVVLNNVCFGPATRGISVFGTGHVLKDNRTQDADGAYIGPNATFIQRNRYGKETVLDSSPLTEPTLDAWNVGAIVEFKKGSAASTYWLRIPGTWRRLS